MSVFQGVINNDEPALVATEPIEARRPFGNRGHAISELRNIIRVVSSPGTVRLWHREDGWGVIDSPHTPGGCFAHFSNISGVVGFRELVEGESVEFDWEPSPAGGQDGCAFRALTVRTQSSA